ncbi:hypothetical protein ASF70_12775 [Rhizobium sp. Leaf321]|nr:hypothetical protein ASF70_12775 [Rhizobium sp. Leaf321]
MYFGLSLKRPRKVTFFASHVRSRYLRSPSSSPKKMLDDVGAPFVFHENFLTSLPASRALSG